MKKVLITSVMALATAVAFANAPAKADAACTASSCAASSCSAEAAFVAKLGKAQGEAFAKMTAQQKASAVAMKDVTPDAAVDRVLKDSQAVAQAPAK